jgi:hypothetical protein
MQDDAVEVSFCDLCGASVPDGDLTKGTALRHQGKTIGGCCLVALRAGQPAAAAPILPRPTAGDGRLLQVAVVLLAAIAAATIFVDQRVTRVDRMVRQDLEAVAQAQRSDSEVLQSLGVAMDSVPRNANVDHLAAKLMEAGGAQATFAADAERRHEQLRGDLVALQQRVDALGAAMVDPRPWFDEMKQRLQRLADQVAAQRLVEPVATAVVPEAAPAEPPADAGATPALPAALAEQVGRLRAADPAVRFEAVDSLLRSKVVDVVPHLLPMVNDADPYVRRITVDGLRDYKRPDVVGVLLVALGDADENVRDTAYASLKLVTGQRIAFEAAASKDARARAVQRWQEWWDKNKATFGS